MVAQAVLEAAPGRADDLESAPAFASPRSDGAAPVVIVGSGPAGVRVAERLAAIDSARPVLLLGDEPLRPYDRVSLSALVAREVAPAALFRVPALERLDNVSVQAGRRIVRIDRASRCVFDARGERFSYSKLVLATGSRPRLPAIPGSELDGVLAFRSMRDAERLLARQIGSRSTVVVGGGLLGLEAARAMCRFNTRVTVVEHESRLMFHQLDPESAVLLQAHVERLGIRVHVAESVQQIVGRYGPELVRLRSGAEIECDTVVLATGILPNIELARDAGLAIGRGIRVDDSMHTSDPDIYAVGECAEHDGQVYGLVAPGLEQAGVAANDIAGRAANYRGSIVASSLKVVGCPVFSMGDVVDSARPYRACVHRAEDSYRRINLYRGRIIGAVGFGEWDTARLRQAGLERMRIWPWQRLRFVRTGRLWPADSSSRIGAWPASATVCSCRGVTKDALDSAIVAGAASVDSLAAATGASSVCGSCKPLLASLLGSGKRLPLRRTLLTASAIAAIAALAAGVISVPYAESMSRAWMLDRLWTDSLLKQISGYTLLSLALLVSLISLRKRLRRFAFARYPSWQLVHVVIGLFAIVVLAAHTGFRFGANLNAWLMFSFTGLVGVGALGGVATALAERFDAGLLRRVRTVSLWAHILLLWPLPALVGFHILKGYYF